MQTPTGTIYDPSVCTPAWWQGEPQTLPITWRGRLARGYYRTVIALSKLLPKSDLTAADFDWNRFRRFVDSSEGVIAVMPKGVHRDVVTLGDIEAEWFRAADAPTPTRTVLYVHGGSYILGRSRLHDVLAANLAKDADARVLAVDYRFAPEHPFPTPIEDVVASYLELLAQGLRPQDIAIFGDSAGGGLALAALLTLRDTGQPLPAAYVALCPWADLTFSGASIIENADADPFMSNTEAVSIFAELYLQGTPASHPLASPALAELHGLPDTLVHVGSTDLLLDDSRSIVANMRKAGGNARLDIWQAMPHVWQRLQAFIPEAECSMASIAHFLKRRIP